MKTRLPFKLQHESKSKLRHLGIETIMSMLVIQQSRTDCEK